MYHQTILDHFWPCPHLPFKFFRFFTWITWEISPNWHRSWGVRWGSANTATFIVVVLAACLVLFGGSVAVLLHVLEYITQHGPTEPEQLWKTGTASLCQPGDTYHMWMVSGGCEVDVEVKVNCLAVECTLMKCVIYGYSPPPVSTSDFYPSDVIHMLNGSRPSLILLLFCSCVSSTTVASLVPRPIRNRRKGPGIHYSRMHLISA